MRKLCPIGYQSTTVPNFLATLKDGGVDLLVDVRALALSRRPGFAKSVLRADLETVGIQYLHLRQLGTPVEGRVAARAGRNEKMHGIFREQLATQGAQDELYVLPTWCAVSSSWPSCVSKRTLACVIAQLLLRLLLSLRTRPSRTSCPTLGGLAESAADGSLAVN